MEIGVRDLEKNKIILVRRDTLEKIEVEANIEEIINTINKTLDNMQQDMYNKVLKRRNQMLYSAQNYEEFKQIATTKSGFRKNLFWQTVLNVL